MRTKKKTYSLKMAILAILFALGTVAAQAAQPAASIKAKADSTTLIQGDRVTVNVEVLKNSHEGQLVGLPKPNTDFHGLEYLECSVDSTDLGNDRVQLLYHVYFQAFDPAELVTLPPFKYVIGSDTLVSNNVSFKVLPVDLSPELGDPEDIENLTIHPEDGPVVFKAKWYDWIPDWWIWVVIGILVIGLGVMLYMLYKINGPKIFTPRRKPTPYEIAVDLLGSLKQRRLLEQGQTKQYYTELVDILRNYLEGRFGINAMEMTSKQILRHIRENKEIHLTASQMEQVLKLADFVKFAAFSPNADEGQRTFNQISQFVESTKPIEVAEDPQPVSNAPTKGILSKIKHKIKK